MGLKLIPDKELDSLEKEDRLGTLPYVDTLHEIVKKCDTPFNIGLLAGWGGGKSSIIETLIKRIHADNLKNQKEEIVVFKYDAWKYSEDPFRRTFIIELVRALQVKGFDNLDSLLYDNSSTETEGQTKFSPNFWLRYVFLFPIIVLLVWFFNVEMDTKAIITGLGVLTSVVLFVLKETFTTYKITIHKSKVIEPEKFEGIFGEIVDKVIGNERLKWSWVQSILGRKQDKQVKKLLIVIDNIDRCHAELVVQLLLTIKNFLDRKNVIFILPVDESGVTFFLQNKNQSATEFLRKIFNTTIRIKHYSNDEMFDYAWKLVETHGLDKSGISRDIVNIVCQEYTTNPRKIIQFLNNFQMEVFLVKQQERLKYLNDSEVSGNFPFLCKLAIIREEWPSLYQKLFERNHLMRDIDAAISDNRYKESDGKKYQVQDGKELPELDEKQYLFFQRTRGIVSTGSIEPFFVNRDLMKDIPDSINDLITTGDWEKIRKLTEDESIGFEKILDAIKKRFDTDIIKRRLYITSGNAIFRMIKQVVGDEKYSELFLQMYSKSDEYRFINTLINSLEFDAELKKIAPNEIMPLAKWLHTQKFAVLAEKALKIIEGSSLNGNEKLHLEFIKSFAINFKSEQIYLSKSAKRLSDILQENAALLNEIDEILNEEQVCRSIFTADFITHNINTIDSQTVPAKQPKLKFLAKLRDFNILNDSQLNSIASKFISFLNSNNDWNYTTMHFKVLKEYCRKEINQNTLQSFRSVINNKHNHFVQQIRQVGINNETQACYESYFDLLLAVMLISNQDETDYLNKIHEIGFYNSHQGLINKAATIYENIARSSAVNFKVLSHLVQSCNSLSDQSRKEQLINSGAEEIVKHSDVDTNNFYTLLDSAFRQYFEQPDARTDFMLSFLNRISQNVNAIEPTAAKIKSLPNIENKKLLLKLADKVEKPEIIGDVAKDIVLHSKDTADFGANLIYVLENYSRGKDAVKQSVISALKSKEGAELNTLISIVIANKSRMEKSVIDMAASQLKAHLTSKNQENINFAFSQLILVDKNEVEDKTVKTLVSLIKGIEISLDPTLEEMKNNLISKLE